ncbi:helix-turn-helix domain-containing protein [Sphingomonas oligoaromativorans]|uniref:helix-turn-helix domain-containing protein n=1 Tax=Sphingomonas oligoaromativorans TaxID=575322 RepID=UPI00141FB1FE|nr:helix-turn-helix domain-containing protein [Sphingomonas oligoaromativorans]NIJ32792.1 hypothetical protein [Sphingomonas oligoaromativorans]
MSIALMRAAWQAHLPNGSDKLVLVAMADFANESGEAWPSIPTLAKMCSRGETAVREALQRLVTGGHLTRRVRQGQSSRFEVHPRANPSRFPDPLGIRTPSEIDTPTPPDFRTPPLPISEGDPSRFPDPNHQEPPLNHHNEPPKGTGAAKTVIPDWIPDEAWKGFVDMRRRQKAPLAGRALSLTISKLSALRAAGYEPGAILDQSTSNGWKGLFPLKENINGQQRYPAPANEHGTGSRNASGNPMLRAVLARRAGPVT